MKYAKPEVVVLAVAVKTIQGSTGNSKPSGLVQDHKGAMYPETIGAYEADE